MRAGELRHRIAVLSQALAANDTGEEVETWTLDGYVWGMATPKTGREWFVKGDVSPEVTHFVQLRYKRSLDTTDRLLAPIESTTLGAALATDDGTSATLTVALQPGAAFDIRIEDELINVSAGFGTTSITIARGQHGSTAATHLNGAAVSRLVALDIESILDTDLRNRETIVAAREHG